MRGRGETEFPTYENKSKGTATDVTQLQPPTFLSPRNRKETSLVCSLSTYFFLSPLFWVTSTWFSCLNAGFNCVNQLIWKPQPHFQTRQRQPGQKVTHHWAGRAVAGGHQTFADPCSEDPRAPGQVRGFSLCYSLIYSPKSDCQAFQRSGSAFGKAALAVAGASVTGASPSELAVPGIPCPRGMGTSQAAPCHGAGNSQHLHQ